MDCRHFHFQASSSAARENDRPTLPPMSFSPASSLLPAHRRDAIAVHQAYSPACSSQLTAHHHHHHHRIGSDRRKLHAVRISLRPNIGSDGRRSFVTTSRLAALLRTHNSAGLFSKPYLALHDLLLLTGYAKLESGRTGSMSLTRCMELGW